MKSIFSCRTSNFCYYMEEHLFSLIVAKASKTSNEMKNECLYYKLMVALEKNQSSKSSIKHFHDVDVFHKSSARRYCISPLRINRFTFLRNWKISNWSHKHNVQRRRRIAFETEVPHKNENFFLYFRYFHFMVL